MGTTRLDDAVRALDGAVLGPNELAGALGFDPLAVSDACRARRRGARAVLARRARRRARATASSSSCASRATPTGPLTMLGWRSISPAGSTRGCTRASATCCATSGPIDAQPFATAGDLRARAGTSSGATPLPATLNRRLPRAGRGAGGARADASGRPAPPQRRRDRLGHAPLAARPRRAPAGERLGLVAEPEQRRQGSPRSASSATAGPRRDRLLAGRPLRHPRRLPAALTALPARRRALLGAPPRVLRHHEAGRATRSSPPRRASAPPSGSPRTSSASTCSSATATAGTSCAGLAGRGALAHRADGPPRRRGRAGVGRRARPPGARRLSRGRRARRRSSARGRAPGRARPTPPSCSPTSAPTSSRSSRPTAATRRGSAARFRAACRIPSGAASSSI